VTGLGQAGPEMAEPAGVATEPVNSQCQTNGVLDNFS